MPNPYVLPSGVKLKIDGLVEGSTVKIITLSGEVIKEFDSPGGRIASWDGTDKKGNLVPSGIYIVVAFNKDASKVGKGKVAIIRKN
jgi:flagellar hook assembly protein FlgD